MTGRKTATFMVAAALVGCMMLVGCGAQQKESDSATQQTTQTSTQTESTETTEAAAPATEPAAPAAAPATSSEQSAQQAPSTPAPADTYIGEDAAKSAALNHAGIAQENAMGLKAELDLDDAPIHYDVEFKAGGMEYDYDIDAVTGEVLKFESEVDD